jgi:hypothetical protein
MYDGTDFVTRLTVDPGDSLEFGPDDRWSYPVPVTPSPTAHGRERFITSRLVRTDLRKLYQPSHTRFYAVVVEVFCDAPGLPRAGSHTDFDVTFVMRRQHTSIAGDPRAVRKLARRVLNELAKEQPDGTSMGTPDLDAHEVWWASEANRLQFEEDNAALFDDVEAHTEEQAWMVGPAGGQWRLVGSPPAPGRPPKDAEEHLPMWRLPPRTDVCDAANTRSLWFGLVPTYAADHWTDENGKIQPKLDDHAIYQLRCVVTKRPARGHEHCPPKRDESAPTQPFRLAAAYDPDGTKNRTISITAPDLRRLAARAGQRQGPGGLRISSPPNSSLSPVDFKSIPGAGLGRPGGGAVCTFAFELFFIVAFFLFLLFLPIVVLAFQLWWMLALRFCIPPSLSFGLVADFFAAGGLLTNLNFGGPNPAEAAALDEIIGVHDAATALLQQGPDATLPPEFLVDPEGLTADLVSGIDPADAQLEPEPPPHLITPPDPLCPVA